MVKALYFCLGAWTDNSLVLFLRWQALINTSPLFQMIVKKEEYSVFVPDAAKSWIRKCQIDGLHWLIVKLSEQYGWSIYFRFPFSPLHWFFSICCHTYWHHLNQWYTEIVPVIWQGLYWVLKTTLYSIIWAIENYHSCQLAHWPSQMQGQHLKREFRMKYFVSRWK
jgi:hypothetical protein